MENRPPSSRIDRNPQNLPVGAVQMGPVRQARRTQPWLRFWRRNTTNITFALGLVLALLAAALTFYRGHTVVDMESDGIHVGDSVLHPAGSGDLPNSQLYRGQATYVLLQYPRGLWRATAVSAIGNVNVEGVCQITALTAAEATESCTFALGPHHLSATDVLRFAEGSFWRRRYSDGRTATIAVSSQGSLIPVPFPIGR